MDYILSLTREFIDLGIIVKTYTRKWDLKFKVKDFVKQTVIESLNFEYKETQFIWYMSHSRYVVFSLLDFHTKPRMIPFKKEDKIGMCYFSKKLTMYHA